MVQNYAAAHSVFAFLNTYVDDFSHLNYIKSGWIWTIINPFYTSGYAINRLSVIIDFTQHFLVRVRVQLSNIQL